MRSDPDPLRNPCTALSEAELVTQARGGSDAAVRVLVRDNNQKLFRIARGILRNDAEAEGAVQAAYVTAFTKLESFRGEAAFSTWLTRIVMNEAYGRLRRQRPVVDLAEYREGTRNRLDGEFSDPMTFSPSNPESELGRAEVRKFLEAAIDALPEPFRLTYVLRDVQEMTTRQVAALLNINVVTVKTRLFRARRLLRSELQKNISGGFSGIFPFDGARCAGMADRVIRALAGRQEG
ncbi:RNA polymerase sigma factor [Oceaniovalibus sp. ACAM 378]|uniref:RNA polymerase sigma factor n=1 Tax=Oceaniovalibus sp. ACAM 378 TaxID=2599923 RepID=UPI0011D3BB85|nr:RNA polymerase sigma factor [Oceaniovalibus sp. ACAM 378]TYB91214.1 RNA polymerase sigma factor [Oceaniovalibus sp. ACAM 378]